MNHTYDYVRHWYLNGTQKNRVSTLTSKINELNICSERRYIIKDDISNAIVRRIFRRSLEIEIANLRFYINTFRIYQWYRKQKRLKTRRLLSQYLVDDLCTLMNYI